MAVMNDSSRNCSELLQGSGSVQWKLNDCVL